MSKNQTSKVEKMALKDFKKIVVTGRRWFDRINGNTYNTVDIFIDDEFVIDLPREYGYGNYYFYRAMLWLAEFGYIENRRSSCNGLLWREQFDERGIKFVDSVIDVKRKRDL